MVPKTLWTRWQQQWVSTLVLIQPPAYGRGWSFPPWGPSVQLPACAPGPLPTQPACSGGRASFPLQVFRSQVESLPPHWGITLLSQEHHRWQLSWALGRLTVNLPAPDCEPPQGRCGPTLSAVTPGGCVCRAGRCVWRAGGQMLDQQHLSLFCRWLLAQQLN